MIGNDRDSSAQCKRIFNHNETGAYFELQTVFIVISDPLIFCDGVWNFLLTNGLGINTSDIQAYLIKESKFHIVHENVSQHLNGI